jgi:Sulfite exporter TauE/SafE.
MISNFTKSLASKNQKLITFSKFVMPIHRSFIRFLSSIIRIRRESFTTPLIIARRFNIRFRISTAAACRVPIAAAGAIRYMYFSKSTEAILPPRAFGYVFWPPVFSFSLASILTARFGANISPSISEKKLKISFGLFLILIGILVIVN